MLQGMPSLHHFLSAAPWLHDAAALLDRGELSSEFRRVMITLTLVEILPFDPPRSTSEPQLP